MIADLKGLSICQPWIRLSIRTISVARYLQTWVSKLLEV
jgi:hypothetical protein